MTYYIGKSDESPKIPALGQLWKHASGLHALIRVSDGSLKISDEDRGKYFASANLSTGEIIITPMNARDIVRLKVENCVFVPE